MTQDTILILCYSIGVTGASIFAVLYLREHYKIKYYQESIRLKDEQIKEIQEWTALLIKEVKLIKQNYEERRNP